MARQLIAIAGFALALGAHPAAAQMSIPTDMAQTCTVDSSTFDKWFVSGSPSADGVVASVNSADFTGHYGGDPDVCDFYVWGAQMFLWLTSPDGDGLVLDGPAFFNVSTENSAKQRTLIPNVDGAPLNLALRSEKIGEVGQAGTSGVLFSQQGSMVYYGVHVNMPYGYFLTGQKEGAFPGQTDFPHNKAERDALLRYVATAYPGVDLLEADTLAIELKTSWVDAATVPDPSSYVVIEGIVPAYPTAPGQTQPCIGLTSCDWDGTSTTTMKLALVGVHVVGTVQDHPEFVWATFEHISNAPDAGYYYQPASGTEPKQHAYDSDGDFVFIANGAAMPAENVECAAVAGGTSSGSVIAHSGGTVCNGVISASDTVRFYPWGSKPIGPSDVGENGVTQDEVDQVIENNTLLLSINASVRGMLSAGDVRANYVQTGAIWTTTPPEGGDAPIPNQTGPQTDQMRGSLTLSNATMETYTQGTTCFDCHQVTTGDANSFGTKAQPDQLSHIYFAIQPLPK